MSEEADVRNAVAKLIETRKGKYTAPELFKTGGTRYLYESKWGHIISLS